MLSTSRSRAQLSQPILYRCAAASEFRENSRFSGRTARRRVLPGSPADFFFAKSPNPHTATGAPLWWSGARTLGAALVELSGPIDILAPNGRAPKKEKKTVSLLSVAGGLVGGGAIGLAGL